MTEQWKPIAGYEDAYEVSSLGRVKSLARTRFNSKASLSSRVLVQSVGGHGYPTVSLWKEGLPIKLCVHRLVACAFVPNPEGKPEVNHKNGIKTQVNVDNLEWTTYLENTTHAFAKGLNPVGSKRTQAKLDEADIVAIRASNFTQQALGKLYKVDPSLISRIVAGKRWHHVR